MELEYIKKLYEKLQSDDEIVKKFGITKMTLWRWKNGRAKPRFKKDLDLIESITGFNSQEVELQIAIFKIKKASLDD